MIFYEWEHVKFEYVVESDEFVYTVLDVEKRYDRVEFFRDYMGATYPIQVVPFPPAIYTRIPSIMRKIKGIVKINTDSDTLTLFPENREFPTSCTECMDNFEYLVKINGNLYCVDCLLSLDICEECGKVHLRDDMTEIEGNYYCNDCRDENYTKCTHCGDWIENDSVVVVDNGTRNESYACPDCASSHYERCIECGDYFSSGGATLQNGQYVCQSCIEDRGYYSCDRCGDWFPEGDMEFGDTSCLCSSCYREFDNGENESVDIHRHWSKLRPIFHGEGPLFFGIEQEIDKGSKAGKTAEEIMGALGEEALYIETDGSLGDTGLELVYHPRTWGSWKEYRDRLETVKNIAREHEYLAHETDTCGLHIHASRNAIQSDAHPNIEANIGKIMLLYENSYKDFVKFSRRKERSLNEWAARNPLYFDSYARGESYYAAAAETGNRYMAVNIQNSPTVEFRFFRGTLLPDTILASIGLCYNIIQLAISKNEEELKELTFSDIVNYDNGSDYVKTYWNFRIVGKTKLEGN